MIIPRTAANPEPQQEHWPSDLDEAKRWITNVRDLYRREVAYRERLEREVSRQRRVVEIAQFWHHARGMHRAPWLGRLKAAVVEFEDAERNANV